MLSKRLDIYIPVRKYNNGARRPRIQKLNKEEM